MKKSKPAVFTYYAPSDPYFVAYMIGLCRESARLASWTNDRWIKFHEKFMAADEDKVLTVVKRYFKVEGKAA